MGRVTLRLGGVELQGAQVDNHLVLTAAAFAAVGGEVVAQPATESSDSSASSDGEEREAASANPPRRAESSSSSASVSPCTRRSRSPPPKPPARVPPTPPPPPARSERQQDRQPDKRKRPRGSRAGEQVKAARPALAGSPFQSRGGERRGPFQKSTSSNSGLFGQPPRPSPFRALGTVPASAASRRTDLHDPAHLPQVSASPFFLQPVPRVLPPWLPSRRRNP